MKPAIRRPEPLPNTIALEKLALARLKRIDHPPPDLRKKPANAWWRGSLALLKLALRALLGLRSQGELVLNRDPGSPPIPVDQLR